MRKKNVQVLDLESKPIYQLLFNSVTNAKIFGRSKFKAFAYHYRHATQKLKFVFVFEMVGKKNWDEKKVLDNFIFSQCCQKPSFLWL